MRGLLTVVSSRNSGNAAIIAAWRASRRLLLTFQTEVPACELVRRRAEVQAADSLPIFQHEVLVFQRGDSGRGA